MGRITLALVLTASLTAGAAVAQQGLIVEPWRSPPAPHVAVVPAPRATPESTSGLGNGRHQLPRLTAAVEPAPAPPPPLQRWAPPVVELLVDPWAKPPALMRAPRLAWVPPTTDIIDPWAGERSPPRVVVVPTAAAPLLPERTTIF